MVIKKQQDLQDCGVCSLASIIEYYDGYIPMERLRMDTHTTKDGTSAYNLLIAAQKYGFEVMGIKIASLDDASIKLPAIGHMKYKNGLNHFIVIYEITKTKVILMDPAKGKVILKRQDFWQDFSQVLLLFYPKEKIMVLDKGKNVLQVFLTILMQEKRIVTEIIIISILLTIATIFTSYYFKVTIEAITENIYLEYLKLIVILFAILTIFKCLFTYMRSYLENHLNKNIDCLLESDFLNHLFKLPSKNILSRSNGEILSRVRELNNIKAVYTELFINCFLDFILVVFSIPILIFISGKMFLILFSIAGLYFIIGLLTMKSIYHRAYQNITYEEEFNNYLLECINTYPTLKNLNLTNYSLKNMEEKLSRFIYDSFCFNNFLNKEENLKNSINEIGFFIINTIGIYLIIHDQLSIANLITFNSLMVYFLNPLKNLIDVLPKYNFMKATFVKISDFINIPTEKIGKRTLLNKSDITVNNLEFSYNDFNKILTNLKFNIKQGSKVMFKGQSGCGKSTMCKILIKEFENYDGTITIGTKNLKDYSLKTIRDNILYVSQEESLFSDTIYNNLVLGRNISNEKFENIVKICSIDKIIDKKNFRYETFINNTNLTISGGEKQRIILARALLKEAKILILDEPLSEVDYNLEREIIINLKNYYKDKTIIYITHKNQDDLFDQVINFSEAI